jgi:hypothetical protein
MAARRTARATATGPTTITPIIMPTIIMPAKTHRTRNRSSGNGAKAPAT